MDLLIQFHKNSALSSIFDFVLHHLHHLQIIIMMIMITNSITNTTTNISITNTIITNTTTNIISIIIIELWTCELRTVQAGSLLLELLY